MVLCWHKTLLVVLFLHCTLLLAECPPLGPILPAPTGLRSSPAIQQLASQGNALLQNLTSSFNQTAVSIGVRSIHDDAPLFDFHYTPPEYNTSGTHHVDGNTVYRIGSTTKLFTALGILKLKGKINLSDPITKYIPRLNNISPSANDTLAKVEWNKITIQALASHMGGVPADISGNAIQYTPAVSESLGLPQLSESQQSLPCGDAADQPPCSWDVFFDNIGKRPPVYPPFTTPVYSNIGYSLLGRVIENVSGQTYEDYLQQNIIKTAGMNRTTVTGPPANNLGFIPAESNWWSTSLGFEQSEGGLYTSNNDLLSFGTAILSNKLLDPVETRTWMKPVTFTSSSGQDVGAPWEIVRGTNLTSDGRIVDFYAKTGDVGDYSSVMVLVPDYDLVMAMNFAGPEVDDLTGVVIFSQLAQALIPVIDEVGKSEAGAKFNGTFTSGQNSTLTLTVDDFGLLVSNFSANGADVAEGYSAMNQATGEQTTIRLYPTNIQAGNRSAWRAVYTIGTAEDAAAADAQLFFPQGSCETWLFIDRLEYGLQSLDYFVLTEDDAGQIAVVEPMAWRLALKRTG